MRKLLKLSFICFFLSFVLLTQSIDNGAGKTPPMGWTTRNAFGCNINQTIIQQQAFKLIQTNLANKGYRYVILDDCWQGHDRNLTTGKITEDFYKFPSGIDNLSLSIHSKGLKIGLTSDIGVKTCQNRPGSYGYEKIDANTYAKWAIDYLKYDNCNHSLTATKLRFYIMQKALNQTGNSIFLAIDDQGNDRVWEWGSSVANSWKTVQNVDDKWSSFLNVLQKQVGLEKYSTIGAWNDPGLLLTGSSILNYNEQYAQFVFWCILKAPLIIGSDLMKFSAQDLEILSNQELIEINQDSLGIQARRIKSEIGSSFKREVWGGSLSDNKFVLVFFNRGQTQTSIEVSLKKQIGIEFSSYTQRDPIRHTSIGISDQNSISLKVAPHFVEVRILSLIKQPHLTFQ